AGKGEVTIAYRVTEKADRNLGYQRVGGVKGSFVFDWKAPTGSALKPVKASFAFTVGGFKPAALEETLPGKDGSFALEGKSLEGLLDRLLAALSPPNVPPDALPATIEGEATLTPLGDDTHA